MLTLGFTLKDSASTSFFTNTSSLALAFAISLILAILGTPVLNFFSFSFSSVIFCGTV